MDCPEPAIIAQLVGGGLAPGDMAAVEAHLDACSRCLDLVAAAVSPGNAADGQHTRAAGGFLPGARLGRYEVRQWIGRGGMGDVYEGFDPKLERPVAIKVLRGEHTRNWTAERRLEREAKILARLSSPNVVAVLDVDVFEDRVFLVMEFVKGTTLSNWLQLEVRPWQQIVTRFLEAGDGLAAAHEVGVTHRDFKPQNVLIGADGTTRVADFGLARGPDSAAILNGNAGDTFISSETSRQTLTETGAVLGTPRYMAPEQLLNQVVNARTDQFSFCVGLYEALYGRHPFPAGRADGSDEARRMKQAVLNGHPTTSPRTKTSGSIEAALLRGLALKADDRFPSMRELLATIRRAMVPRRKRILVPAVALMAVALATAALVWLTTSKTNQPVILEPQGTPQDWTDARIAFQVSERVYCLMPIAKHMLRVVWGNPHRVVDIDPRDSSRRSPDLLPETYRYGCPVLSPDGRQLIYEGYDSDNRPHIFHAGNPRGQGALPIVPSADPSHDSHPLWLSSGQEFIFDADSQHLAVYSIATNRATIVSDNPESNMNDEFFKTVSRTGDHIAVSRRVGGNSRVNIYGWPSLRTEEMFQVASPISTRWRFGIDPTFIFGTLLGSMRRLAVVNIHDHQLWEVASMGNRDFGEIAPIDKTTMAFTTFQKGSNIWYESPTGSLLQIPREASVAYGSPSLARSGDILFARSRSGGADIAVFDPHAKKLRQVTPGPADCCVSALPSGEWLLARIPTAKDAGGIFRCLDIAETPSLQCQLLVRTEALFWGLSASPDGRFFAYSELRAQGVMVRIASAVTGLAIDLAWDAAPCQLLWSSAHTLWFSRRDKRMFIWTEIDVETKRPTGRVSAVSTGCLTGDPDPHPPIVRYPSEVVTWDSDVRLHALAGIR